MRSQGPAGESDRSWGNVGVGRSSLVLRAVGKRGEGQWPFELQLRKQAHLNSTAMVLVPASMSMVNSETSSLGWST